MTTTTPDTLLAWLHSLISVTEGVSGRLEANDELTSVEAMLNQRDELLSQQKKWVAKWKELKNSADNTTSEEALEKLKLLLEKLVNADKQLVTSVTLKKRIVSEQLKQAQNQKLLLAYSI